MSDLQQKKQSNFSHDDIKKRLIGFNKADNNNLGVLKLGMWIKYITKKNGQNLFRQGGVLTYVDPEARFIMLKTLVDGKIPPWSVQIKDSIIFYKDRSDDKKRFNTLLEKVGSIELLEKIVDTMGNNNKSIVENIQYLDKYYKGKVYNIRKS